MNRPRVDGVQPHNHGTVPAAAAHSSADGEARITAAKNTADIPASPGGTPAQRIKDEARALGFSAAGICSAAPDRDANERLRQWLEKGYHASMSWMAARAEERSDPARLLPGAQSIISLAMNYYTPHAHAKEPEGGKVSRYAWGDDYHEVVGERAKKLSDWLVRTFPGERALWYVDTGPVLEKVWASRAGIGWIGKNANLITDDMGSWVFLGEVITTLALPADEPATDHCGTCVLCLEACPTGAIVEPSVIDSNRCLSYLTIEHRGDIDPAFRDRHDGWVFGCDVCQDVCPWNQKFATPTAEVRFQPRPGHLHPPLDEWSGLTPAQFAGTFSGSPIRRAKNEGLKRNIRLVRGEDPAGTA